MDLFLYIQLCSLCVINVVFTFFGIFLNTMVILTLWRFLQFRKKLCYFTLMVLSCFDIIAVLTNHPMLLIYSIIWISEDNEGLHKLYAYVDYTDIFLGFSLLALLVMNLDRYLATAYPLFHRASITRRRLVTILMIFIFFEIILTAMSANHILISDQAATMIFAAIVSPPLFFINFRLFRISRKMTKRNATSPLGIKNSNNIKNISSCLLAVVCIIFVYLPMTIYIALSMNQKSSSYDVRISWLWTKTIITMNSTFNCLIFFWKNKLLRTEGVRVLKLSKLFVKS